MAYFWFLNIDHKKSNCLTYWTTCSKWEKWKLFFLSTIITFTFWTLGFMISDNTTLDKHISTVCHSAYVKIRCISYIHQYLTAEAAKTLVCAFVLSRLDWCESSLSSCLALYFLSKLQKSRSDLCCGTGFQTTQMWSCASSSASSSLDTSPSQNRLQTVNCLSQLILWIISCLFLWPSHWLHTLQAVSFFTRHTDTS